MGIIEILILVLLIIVIILLVVLVSKTGKSSDSFEPYIARVMQTQKELEISLGTEVRESRVETLNHMSSSFKLLGDLLATSQKSSSEAQDQRLQQLDRKFAEMALENEQKLDQIRNTMEKRISAMQEDNNKQLDQMRQTVDEKLQKTLEERISKSFQLVSERLEQVYKGLGEMQTLAIGVGDLKKVLSNVKTRGMLGEIQLGSILEQILPREQYDENVVTKAGSNDRVEFAIKLPGDESGTVYLPIDAKFPAETYEKLLDAYESGNGDLVNEMAKVLEKTIKQEAKTIRDKYVDPPNTTDFAILFLPTEGLYAEVVKRGMVEVLQREFKVNIAGPTTMAALLNSLQMGFRTLAIQKHSSEVWHVLGAVKTEFDKFGDILASTQKKLTAANEDLEKLIGTRTKMIQRKLRDVASLKAPETEELFAIEAEDVEEEWPYL